MWVLRNSRGGLYYLLVEKSHIVSRKDGDLILADDQSISRRHAIITVEHDIKNLGDPSKLPLVSLTDMGSKYGTFVNNGIEVSSRIANGSTVILSNGDRIQFGLQWNEWSLEYIPLVVTASTLTSDEKKSLKQNVITLGGHIVSSWEERVTHVTMSNLMLTVKAVCALAHGNPIITPQYWDSYITALLTKQPCPDCKDYIPPLAETTINMNEVSFDVNENRKKLFAGKHFVFLSSHQYNVYSCMVTTAGAQADVLEKNGMTFEDLVQPNIIVMQYSFNRLSQDSQVPQPFQEVTKYLKSRGKRVIPESDIGLAILHCSIDRHCNPDYKVTSALLSKGSRIVDELILALDTPESESESLKKVMETRKDIVIPESGTVQKLASSGVISTPTDLANTKKSVAAKDKSINIAVSSMKKERLSETDEVDASPSSRKRCRSLEDDGFLTKRSAAPEQSQATIKVKPEVKEESDDEDLFAFASDKKLRLTTGGRTDEEVEDIFAFADEAKPKLPLVHIQKDEPAEFCELSKKRKLRTNEIVSEPGSFSKKRALDEDVLQNRSVEPQMNEPTEHNITLADFLTIDQEGKENKTQDESMMGLVEEFRNVTVVEVKPLISRNVSSISSYAFKSNEVGINFKKFKKVQTVNRHLVIRSQDLVPHNFDSNGPYKWSNETRNRDDVEDKSDDDWTFIKNSHTNKKKHQAKCR